MRCELTQTFTVLLLCLTGSLVGSACAPAMPVAGTHANTTYEILGQKSNRPEKLYEGIPEELDPSTQLPGELLESSHHSVTSMLMENDLLHTYVIQTEHGSTEARGMGLLRKRVHEYEALAALKKAAVDDTDVYVLALANAATDPFEGGAQLLVHPIQTTMNIPRGIWTMASGFYEMTDGGRTHLEDHYISEMIGFSKAKREWSYRLGTDPYTGNADLQSALDRYGWWSLAGGMTVRLPLIAVPGGASIALTVTNMSNDMKRELRNKTPESIRIKNRKLLTHQLGIRKKGAEDFVTHPWYSPSRQVVVTDALMTLSDAKGHDQFIRLAAQADAPHETYAFSRIALLLSAFNERVQTISEISERAGLIVAYSQNGDLVVPLYVDSLHWTQPLAQIDKELEQAMLDRRNKRGEKYLLVSGSVSPLAREELTKRDWVITDELEQSWLHEFDSGAFSPGQPDQERILPEIGS